MDFLKLFKLTHPFTLALTCQICGKPVGETQLEKEMTQEEYRKQASIVDQRCSQCDIDHGTFKELTMTYQAQTGETPNKAEAFVIANPKRADFDIALTTAIAAMEAEKVEPIISN